MPEPQTKGTHVLAAVKVLRGNRERALALLAPPLQKYLEQRILPSSWYPMSEHLALLHAVAKLWPAGSGDPWALMGRATAQVDLTGIYKSHLRVGDPGRTLVAMGALWRSAQDTGTVQITVEPSGTWAEMSLRDYPLSSREFCRVTTGYIGEVLRLAEARDPRVNHVECVNTGHTECKWRAIWTPT